jgi:predicted ribosomally synthesized peptide with nif11-like leader
MSVNNATQFMGKVFEDATLRDRLSAKVGDLAHVNLSENVSAGESIVAIGQEWGYKFDIADLQSAYRGYIEQQNTGTLGVLSDSELELVAGGMAEGDQLCDNTICEKTC